MRQLSLVVGRVAEFVEPSDLEKRLRSSVHLARDPDLSQQAYPRCPSLGALQLFCACKFTAEALVRCIETVCQQLSRSGEVPSGPGGRS